jgi:hypothetical protein
MFDTSWKEALGGLEFWDARPGPRPGEIVSLSRGNGDLQRRGQSWAIDKDS